MIKGILQAGRYVTVTGGYSTGPSLPYTNYQTPSSGAQSFAGNVRYNANSQCLEIFDGNVWNQWVGSNATIRLTDEAEDVLNWAREKQHQEREIERLAASNPAVKDLVEQIKEKQEQLEMVKSLLKSKGDEGFQLVSAAP